MSTAIDQKKQIINDIVSLAERYPTAAVVQLEGIGSSTIQKIRASLREKATEIKVGKNTIKKIALEEAAKKKKGIDKLVDHFVGSCGLVFTEMNPFRLQKFLVANQMPAYAKIGQISPVSVSIPAGSTNLEPGPVIGQLNALGLPTRIERGKIRITKNTEILKIGDEVTPPHAEVLRRLGILPFKAGLSVTTAFEAGELIDGTSLIIDEELTFAQISNAYNNAIALALEVAYPSPETIRFLLQRAATSAKSLAVEANIITSDNVGLILAKAFNKGRSLASVMTKNDSSFSPEAIGFDSTSTIK